MKSILVVEDEVHIRRVYKKLFRKKGYKIIEASNAMEAEDLLKNREIDLILLDINLGEIGGDMLYDLVRMFHKEVKVIVSSICFVEDQKRFIEGAFDYYDKSEGIKVLLNKVERALH